MLVAATLPTMRLRGIGIEHCLRVQQTANGSEPVVSEITIRRAPTRPPDLASFPGYELEPRQP